MKTLLQKKSMLLSCLFVVTCAISLQAQSKQKIAALKEDAKAAKVEFVEADWRMEDRFKEAYGYVIFPNVGKGGLGVGGAAGNGIVYQGGQEIGAAKLSQLSIGFQAGGQAYREIIFFEDKEALDRFMGNNFEFSAQASAVAVTAGASAKADYEGGVMVFTMQKGGLMYEASIGGQKFKFDAF
jgi:lipid-binding SYLF domain-containing protein